MVGRERAHGDHAGDGVAILAAPPSWRSTRQELWRSAGEAGLTTRDGAG